MLIFRILRLFFHQLYHNLAFSYDRIAAIVSFGQWNNWIQSVLPLIEGRRVLELGHGPGHLQRMLRDQGVAAIGLDESAQMGRIARNRLLRAGDAQPSLTRGLGQSLPFPAEAFDSVVSTFPAEYILEAQTLSEARRVLRNGGQLIALPAVWPKNRYLQWLYHVTGESPAGTLEMVKTRWSQPFIQAGFETNAGIHEVKSGHLLIIVATKAG